ncbi:hypothetical protein niasHT_024477 [Heterodera trifolii]|uniref:Uncharacterized protein n=1 Tax=Heterodera trifolii TaxID=157864 RepID=A0ABD2K7M6_9BILA
MPSSSSTLVFLLLLQFAVILRCNFVARPLSAPPDFRDARSIVRSEGEWTRRMGEEFVRHNVLPFIRQFRRQLKPPRNLQWAPGGGNLLPFGPNQRNNRNSAKWGDDQSVQFTHVDLDPAEQRKYRKNHSVASLFDLGGLIARELWKQTKHRCVHCENGACGLADPQCGFPYQLFDERVEQIYCELTLQKKRRKSPAKKPPLKAKMKCATFPPTPSLPNTLLTTGYQKNGKLMCVNCTFPHQSDVDTDYDSDNYGMVEQNNGQNWAETTPMMSSNGMVGYGNGGNRNFNNVGGREWDDRGGREWGDGRGGRECANGGVARWRDGQRVCEGAESGRERNGKRNDRNINGDRGNQNGMDNFAYDNPYYGGGGNGMFNEGGENQRNYYDGNVNAINYNANAKSAFINGNVPAQTMGNEWQQKQRIIRVKTEKKFTLKYQINAEEGQVIAAYINKARARIALGEAPDLPIASGMNQIKWRSSLAAEAVKVLGTSQNKAVNVLDLEAIHLIAGGYSQQQGENGTGYGMNNSELGGAGFGNERDYGFFSGLNKNYIELKATDVLLMVVKNYLEMFMGQKGLNCDEKACKATCKLSKRNREMPLKREDENPAEYFCYPYELIYDHANSIGCAVHFETKRKTELRAKLVCIMSTEHGHKKMLHHHNVFKVGPSCSNCERNFKCDAKNRLCMKRSNPSQNGAQMPTMGRRMDYQTRK